MILFSLLTGMNLSPEGWHHHHKDFTGTKLKLFARSIHWQVVPGLLLPGMASWFVF
jgi:hypothetical protein